MGRRLGTLSRRSSDSILGVLRRQQLTAVLLALAFALLAASAGAAGFGPGLAPVPVEVRQFTTLDSGVRLDRILSGAYDAQFLLARPGAVRLSGAPAITHWLKLSATLPPGEAGADWRLRLERVPFDRMTAYLPRTGSAPEEVVRRFFLPGAGEGPLPVGFAFPLPPASDGRVVLYAAVNSRVDVGLLPVLWHRDALADSERAASNLLSAIYATILVLTLSSLALWLALRESAYLYFVGFTATLLLLLAAVNGHLYALPGVSVLAWWGPLGMLALAFVCCAMTLGLTQKFLELRRLDRRLDRAVDLGRWLLLALALACLLNLHALAETLRQVAILGWMASIAIALAVSAYAARRGQPLARPFLLILLLIGAAIAARSLQSQGWIEAGFWSLRGWQLVLAIGAFLLSIGLADRVMQFRKQRDRAKLAKEQTDASLQVEQGRRELVEVLRDNLRKAPAGDLEWIAFRKMLAALQPLVPQSGSALIAFGYHDLDLLIAEPQQQKERFSQLLAARGGNIKGICRGRTPLQVRLEYPVPDGAQGAAAVPIEGMFAIVPLPVARPGWGAVLIERPAWEEFDAEELKLVVEFAQITVGAADEAASHSDLRRRAELDPLTGALNRRASEQALEELLAHAIDRRQPLSVMVIDLDHFKQVNERHGSEIGDECLRQAAEAIRRLLQPGDLFARFGGEEFLVALPGRQADQARQLADRIREAIGKALVRSKTAVVKFTASIGVAGRGGAEDTPQPLVERAERAMQGAKRDGRNQVQVAPAYGGYGSGEEEPPTGGLVL